MSTLRHKFATGLAALVGALSLVAVAATPASAATTDRPKITETDFDFGLDWVLGAPLNGGYLYWDNAGQVNLQGYMYLKNTFGDCARMHIKYYEDNNLLAEDFSDWEAGSAAKVQYWINESYSTADVSHVHIHIDADRGCDGDWSNLGEVTFTEN